MDDENHPELSLKPEYLIKKILMKKISSKNNFIIL